MRLKAAFLLLLLTGGVCLPRPSLAQGGEAAREARARKKREEEKRRKEQKRRQQDEKRRQEERRREAEKSAHEEKKRQMDERRREAEKSIEEEKEKRRQEKQKQHEKPAVPAPSAAAGPGAARPTATPAPMLKLPAFVKGGAAAPPAPQKSVSGALLTATPLQQAPVQHAAIVAKPAFMQNVATYQAQEQVPNRYYWHSAPGVEYVHYYTGGAHWYGFYVGPDFYWTRYHDSRWWWYDPVYRRWVYYGDGSWWWQDPAQPQAVFVYSGGSYVPSAAAPPDAYAAAPTAGGGAPQTPIGVASVSTAPAYSSDVDSPTYRVAPSSDSFALVIGVENYASLPKAEFAARDAQAVRAHLESLGYPPRNTIVLTDSQAARSSVQKYVETWLPKVVGAGSRVFVYFAGHGAPDPETGQTYLLPWDGDPKFLADTGYPLKQLYAKLDALPAKRVIVALDACFSGAGGRSVLPTGARPLVTKVDTAKGAAGRLVVFSAAAADEITGTAPGQGHGLFTYYFLKGLNGAAPPEGGAVTVQQLYDYLAPNVEDAARRDNRDQTPQLLVPPEGQRRAPIKDAAGG